MQVYTHIVKNYVLRWVGQIVNIIYILSISGGYTLNLLNRTLSILPYPLKHKLKLHFLARFR